MVVLRVRALERRLDDHDDAFEAVRLRLQRREGSESRQKQLTQKQSLDQEIEAIRQASANGSRKRRAAEEADPEVQMVLNAWQRDESKGEKS